MADLQSSLQSLLQVPGLQELLNQGITQQRQAAPLRTAINQQAVNMLPNSAFTRPDMAAIPQANYSTPPPSGMSPVTSALLGAGGGAGLTALLMKLFGNKGGGSGGGGSAPGGSGGGSSFQFGGNDVAHGLKNLLTGKPWNGGSDSSSSNSQSYGPWEPGDPNSPYKVYGPNEPASNNWTSIPDWLQGTPDPGSGGGGGDQSWNDNQSVDGF